MTNQHPAAGDAARLALVVTHTRASTPVGPDYCAECSEAISDWVPWPCARVTLFEAQPCGHSGRVRGCGGCDPGAIEFVRDDGGPWRRVTTPPPEHHLNRVDGDV